MKKRHALVDVALQLMGIGKTSKLSCPYQGRDAGRGNFKGALRMIASVAAGLPAIASLIPVRIAPLIGESLSVVAVAAHAHAPVRLGAVIGLGRGHRCWRLRQPGRVKGGLKCR